MMTLSIPFTLTAHRLQTKLRVASLASTRSFSVLNRPPPNYEGHVPLNVLERGFLAAGSAVVSLLNPRRGGRGFDCPKTLDAG